MYFGDDSDGFPGSCFSLLYVESFAQLKEIRSVRVHGSPTKGFWVGVVNLKGRQKTQHNSKLVIFIHSSQGFFGLHLFSQAPCRSSGPPPASCARSAAPAPAPVALGRGKPRPRPRRGRRATTAAGVAFRSSWPRWEEEGSQRNWAVIFGV